VVHGEHAYGENTHYNYDYPDEEEGEGDSSSFGGLAVSDLEGYADYNDEVLKAMGAADTSTTSTDFSNNNNNNGNVGSGGGGRFLFFLQICEKNAKKK
jgi:hypothetical protein